MSSAFGFNESQLRRDAPRQFTAWHGRCVLDGEPAGHWRDCQVIDVSSTGAGLLLPGVTAMQVRGRRLVLALEFPARVMNMSERGDGLRVGTQFLDISDAEREEMQKMRLMGIRW